MSDRERVVWLLEERCFGEVIGAAGAYYTNIRYITGGIEYEAFIENDEFVYVEDYF